MPTIQKYHQYKVYRNNVYLGDLPTPDSSLSFGWDINTAGTQITIHCPVSVDTSFMAPNYLAAEDGTFLTGEDGVYLTTERIEEIFGDSNEKALFRNGNKLVVWEFSSYWPNGKKMFSGRIKKCVAVFGSATSTEGVEVLAYSDGEDLNNYVIPGSNALFLDQSQPNQNDFGTFSIAGFPGIGETFTIGAGLTNIAAVELWAAATSVPVSLQVSLYTTVNGTLLSTSNVTISNTTPAATLFTFPTPVTVTAGTQYFFAVTVTDGNQANIYVNSPKTYAGGNQYIYGGGSTWYIATTQDMYFKTYYSAYTTKRTFTAVDPTAILSSIIPTYNSQGGLITSNTLTLTSLVVTYIFQLATIYEAIQVAQKLAGPNYYWYVDVGLNQLNFKRVSTTADIKLTKGVHIEDLKLITSTENVHNLLYFTGGPIAGVNLFKTYQDNQSILDNGVQLDRPADNRVTLDATATVIANAQLLAEKGQQYQTQVTILDQTMDITLFKPGQTIGFNGFGSFIDALIIQIVRIDYASEHAVLTLGALPPRTTDALQQVIDDVTSLQTIDNPNSPS